MADEFIPNSHNTFAQKYRAELVEYVKDIKAQDERIFILTKSLVLRLEIELKPNNKL